MNQSNSNDKESAAFSISGNEISCFFVLLSFQFLIVSYFFGITNKSMLPNYVSDFLNIEFFTEKSIEYFLMFFLWSFSISIVIHYAIVKFKKEFYKRFFSCREYIINFIYISICIYISIIYFLGGMVTAFLFIYVIGVCFLYILKCIDCFYRFIVLMFFTTLFISIIYYYVVRKDYTKIDKEYVIITSIGEKIRLNKCLRLGDFIYIDSDKPLVPISQIVKIQPVEN